MLSMERDCPYRMDLLGVVRGGRKKEAALHVKFATYRLRDRNEWFQLSRKLAKFIAVNAMEWHSFVPEHRCDRRFPRVPSSIRGEHLGETEMGTSATAL